MSSNQHLWLDSGHILCPQYGISVAESHMFRLMKYPSAAMGEEAFKNRKIFTTLGLTIVSVYFRMTYGRL